MEDWKAAHLAWIHSTKTFTPKYARDYRADISYYEIMKHLYNDKNCTQKLAEQFFIADKLWHKQTFCLSKAIDNKIAQSSSSTCGRWFVTIGFDHNKWSVEACHKCISKIIAMEWIVSVKANFEFYKSDFSIHPHVHFFIETEEPKSRIKEKLYRPQYVKKLVSQLESIDIKFALPVHYNYIRLIKKEEKMPAVEKDIEWRKANGIPDYEKNWESLDNRLKLEFEL